MSERIQFLKISKIILWVMWLFFSPALAACHQTEPQLTATITTASPSETSVSVFSTQEQWTPTLTPSATFTPGPSPTSTSLPPLISHRWAAEPIMVEAAIRSTNEEDLFGYTPVFILYGDGQLIKRVCQDGACRTLQTQLNQEKLCQLINAIDRTGFLQVEPQAYHLPEGSGDLFRLRVNIYAQNIAEIPNLEQWIKSPNWYADLAGCEDCYDPPIIDPAFINLYQLLINYPERELTGLNSDR
ncbi:MAG: hypothetical protein ACK2TV_01185, partial [Anaerolineales bacterium]